MNKKKIKQLFHRLIRTPLYIFWIFPVKRNRLIFHSFNGNNYSDSCKAMIDYLHAVYPGKYEMYWASENPSELELPKYEELHCIKKHSLRYFYICLTAQVILCNQAQESSLPLRKTQKAVNAWHGMPYKTVGLAKTNFTDMPDYSIYSLFLSPCKFFTEEVIRRSFRYEGPVLNSGLPRNDILFNQENGQLKSEVYKRYHLDESVKIVLFAPTFRGDHEDFDTYLDFMKVINSLKIRFGGEWVLMYRAHPMIKQRRKKLEGVVDATSYPDIMDLLAVSEVLITDYSSSMWDFALTGKPVFLYTPDIKDYSEDRGFYVDMGKLPFQLGHDNNELCDKIINFNEESYHISLKNYFEKMGSFEQGMACEMLAKEIEKWCNNATS